MSRGTLAPGAVVGDGRYRLLAQLGVDERAGAHLWRARDGQLRRDVALTVLVGDPADVTAARAAQRTLERAAHASQFTHSNVARVLDVLSLGNGIASTEGLLGIVVAEWTKGTDLVDVVTDGPIAPATACRMLEPLVEAVERAQNQGIVLGIDHPQRIRRAPDGSLRMVFPGPLASGTLRDDVRALGALLYLLLTGHWPLQHGPQAVARAPVGTDGTAEPPETLQPGLGRELSSLVTRTLADGQSGGVRTSAAFLRMLRQIAQAEEHKAYLRRTGAEQEEPGYTDDDGAVWTTRRPVTDASQRKKLAVGATVLVVAAVGIIAWIGLSLINFFSDEEGAVGPDFNVADTGQQTEEEAEDDGQGGDDQDEASPEPEPLTELEPTEVRVYNPQGTGDHPDRAWQAVDGDPDTAWTTSQYQQQLPALKPGVGLSFSFTEPVEVAKVELLSESYGTEIEIRTADHPNAYLDRTEVVASGEIEERETEIEVDPAATSQYVMVWITRLSGPEGAFSSELNEVTLYTTG
ncbi:hypothetical protein F8178_00600 [Haloechinothrix sp. LS1_15]|nr:hypothetical protein [Haloechinothrix sp. LS1_15]